MLITCNNTACGGIREPNAVAFSSNYSYSGVAGVDRNIFTVALCARPERCEFIACLHRVYCARTCKSKTRSAPRKDKSNLCIGYFLIGEALYRLNMRITGNVECRYSLQKLLYQGGLGPCAYRKILNFQTL